MVSRHDLSCFPMKIKQQINCSGSTSFPQTHILLIKSISYVPVRLVVSALFFLSFPPEINAFKNFPVPLNPGEGLVPNCTSDIINLAIYVYIAVLGCVCGGGLLNCLNKCPGEGLSIWRFTSKLFRFRFSITPTNRFKLQLRIYLVNTGLQE